MLWGDTLGYVWGRRNERTAIPIKNGKQRQTYYGVMNLYNQEFTVTPYANSGLIWTKGVETNPLMAEAVG